MIQLVLLPLNITSYDPASPAAIEHSNLRSTTLLVTMTECPIIEDPRLLELQSPWIWKGTPNRSGNNSEDAAVF